MGGSENWKGRSTGTRTAVATQVLVKAPGPGESLYLLQFNPRWKKYGLLGGALKEEESPLHGACREIEEELGGVRTGWDIMVETLHDGEPLTFSGRSGSTGEKTDYTFYLFQTFFVRPFTDFAYLWAGEPNRWFTLKEISGSRNVSQFPWSEIIARLDVNALPETWDMFLHEKYESAFREALQAFSARPAGDQAASLVLKGIAPSHVSGLGAALRSRLLVSEHAGVRLFSRVRFAEVAGPADGRLELELFPRGGIDIRPHVEEAWVALGQTREERTTP